MLKGATEKELLEEIAAGERDIERGKKRCNDARRALDTICATGEKYVGEIQEQKEKKEKEEEEAKKAAARAAEAGALT